MPKQASEIYVSLLLVPPIWSFSATLPQYIPIHICKSALSPVLVSSTSWLGVLWQEQTWHNEDTGVRDASDVSDVSDM